MQKDLLTGKYVQLEPLSANHKAELQAAADDKPIFAFTSHDPSGENFESWWQNVIETNENGMQVNYVIRRLEDGKVIGNTRFYDIFLQHKRLAIGYTWYINEVWGKGYNNEVKYLMLDFCFNTLDLNRVELATSHLNLRSQAAIQKIGGVFEGILRGHTINPDGGLRHTYVFSLQKEEWNNGGKASLFDKILILK
jgi:RimJ/RimL family protein N-acetyltransferase